jgi:hypothetical protein
MTSPVSPVAITVLPTPPSTLDPTNFDSRADATLLAQQVMVPQINLATTATYTNAVSAFENATSATASQVSAAQSAASAIASPGTNATSTTSNTVSLASGSYTIQANKSFAIGQFIIIASTASPTNYMIAQITAYNSSTGALTIFSSNVGGSGTFSDWTISLTAASVASAIVLKTSATTNIITTATQLVSGISYEANTTSSAFTATLPATPLVGDWIMITDHSGTFAVNNLTVLRNSNLILSLAEDLILDVNNITVLIVYINSAKGWAIK